MSAGIYLLRGDDDLVEMSQQPYEAEHVLQSLIAKFPQLLGGDQYGGGRPWRWLLIGREVPVPDDQDAAGRWSLDHLFLDQDAVPTIVEVKRCSDQRIRRQVIGQMLDYAANGVVYWPLERLRARFDDQCRRDGQEPEEAVREVAGEEVDLEEFWKHVGDNLRAGRVRMVFVSDQIPPELRRVVEFLNGQMNPAEVLAIEVKQYVGTGGARTLVPRVIGQTAEVEARKGRRVRQWDEDSIFASIKEKCGEEEAQIARELYEWTLQRGWSATFGTGMKDAAWIPAVTVAGNRITPIAVYSYGRIEVLFEYLKKYPPFDNEATRIELMNQLNAIPGVSIRKDSITKRPPFPLALLVNAPGAVQQLKRALEWVEERSRGTEGQITEG